MFVTGTVAGKTLDFLIDTGASRSLMSREAYLDLKDRVDLTLQATEHELTAVGGVPLSIYGQVTLSVTFGGQVVDQEFIVVHMFDDCLLGLDFLKHYRCDWSWDEMSMTIQGETVPLHIDDEEMLATRVKAANEIYLAPGSELVVKARLVGWNKSTGLGVVEPLTRLINRHGVIVASSVGNGYQGWIPVRLLNISGREAVIRKDTHLGEFTPIQSVLESTTHEPSCVRRVAERG